MKRVLLLAFCLTLAACGHTGKALKTYHARDYQWHKQTLWLKVHWDYSRPDKDTIVAEGFVEPFSPRNGIHSVNLALVGIGGDGEVVNKASGRPLSNYIASPLATSPFRITMKLNGREEDFTIKGSYYYYNAGTPPDFEARHLDNIPIVADEPY